MICGSGKAAEVKLFGKHQFCGKRLVVLATSRKGETLVLNVDRRGKYGPGLQVRNSQYMSIVANLIMNNRILKMSRFRPPMDVGRVRGGDC